MSGEQSPVCLLLFMLFIIYLDQSIQQQSKTFLLTKRRKTCSTNIIQLSFCYQMKLFENIVKCIYVLIFFHS